MIRESRQQCWIKHRKGIISWITIHLLLFTFYSVSAQSVSASVNREKILLGEQVVLELKLDDFNARTSFLGGWFSVPDSINHMEVIKRNNIDTMVINGLTTYTQKIIITSFDSGRWQLDPFAISIHPFAKGKPLTLATEPLAIEVLPVDVSELKDYHAMKDIEEVEIENNIWLLSAVGLITLLSAFTLWKLLNKKKITVLTPKKSVFKGTPFEWAMEQIQMLEQNGLPSKAEVKSFYSTIDKIYRTYLEDQLRLHSLESTSGEMMIRLKIYMQQEEVRTPFYQLIRMMDAVKFAKYHPGADQHLEAIQIARNTIGYIDQLSQQMKYNNAY